VVGVETPDRYLHLLILLAAETMAVVTISLVPGEVESPGRLCDRVIVSKPVEASDPAKILMTTTARDSDLNISVT
jgi:hypothetical protein